MRALTLITAAGVAAAVAHRLTELNVASLAMCTAIGLGAGIFVAVLCKPDRLSNSY